jgi:hypothetical protein
VCGAHVGCTKRSHSSPLQPFDGALAACAATYDRNLMQFQPQPYPPGQRAGWLIRSWVRTAECTRGNVANGLSIHQRRPGPSGRVPSSTSCRQWLTHMPHPGGGGHQGHGYAAAPLHAHSAARPGAHSLSAPPLGHILAPQIDQQSMYKKHIIGFNAPSGHRVAIGKYTHCTYARKRRTHNESAVHIVICFLYYSINSSVLSPEPAGFVSIVLSVS